MAVSRDTEEIGDRQKIRSKRPPVNERINGKYSQILKKLNKYDIEYEMPSKGISRKKPDRTVYIRERKFGATDVKELERLREIERRMSYDDTRYEDWRRQKARSEIGLIGLFCIICVSIFIMYVSGQLLYDIFFHDFNTTNFAYYMIIFLIGLGAFIGGLKLARNIVLIEYVFDTAFENEIYTRLEPALREVAKVQVDMEDVKLKLDKMNMNVNRMRDFPPLTDNPLKSIEASIYSFLRYVVLINLSIAILLFMLLYPSDFTPYVLTLLYPLWWGGITAEFKLWRVDEVWAWIFLPVLTIPVTIIVLDVVVEYGSLIGLIGAGLMLYAVAYRSWAKYYVEGRFPLQKVRAKAEA
jgi:hypothetical protein